MSNRRWMSSFGQPYFALRADVLEAIPTFGLISVQATFRIDSLPVQSASPTELHPLFSFMHDSIVQPAIFEVGVTPQGQLKAVPKSGNAITSTAALFGDASVWNTLEVGYDGGSGQWIVTLNGSDLTFAADGSPSYLTPTAGYGARLLAFNGRDGLTRMGASISSLAATFQGVANTTLTWGFSERAGGSVASAISSSGTAELTVAPALVAEFYSQAATSPWGSVPSDSPGDAYGWGLATDYTALPQPATAYTQVAA